MSLMIARAGLTGDLAHVYRNQALGRDGVHMEARHRCLSSISATSATGCTVPISLLAQPIETRIVSSDDASAQLVDARCARTGPAGPSDAESGLLQVLADVVDRDVIHLGDDDVVARALVARGVADEREVVRLRGAGREDDLIRLGADERGDLARLSSSAVGASVADVVQRSGVAELLA